MAAIIASLSLWSGNHALRQRSVPDASFILLDGRKITLQSLHGKVVLVNFWSTSCAPCLREMPQLTHTWQQNRPLGFELVAVAMAYDAPNYVLDYAGSRQLPFPVALDPDGATARAFGGISVVPTSFLIDRQGRVVHTIIGIPDQGRLKVMLRSLL